MSPETTPRPAPTRHSYDVVVVTHDSAGCVATCLHAAREFFARRETRFVVVDNASSDGSLEAVKAAVPQADIIGNQQNVGFAVAVNQAVDVCESEFIVLVNPDIATIRGGVADLEAVFEDPSVGAVATRMVDADGALQRSCHAHLGPGAMLSENLALHERFPRWRFARRYRLLDWGMDSVREVPDACGGFLLLRRSAWEAVGRLDERFFLYCEETDWMKRARSVGFKTMYTPDVEVEHRSGQSSGESPGMLSEHLLNSQYRYIRKHHGLAAELSMRSVLCGLDVIRASLGLVPGRSPSRREAAEAARRRLRVHAGVARRRR